MHIYSRLVYVCGVVYTYVLCEETREHSSSTVYFNNN